MQQTLEFDGVEKSFGDRSLLSSIHMVCNSGTITGLLGRNGSGKSTLMKIIFGSLQASYKSVRLNGKPLLGNYIKQRTISYLPQQRFIPDQLKIHQALNFYGISQSELIKPFPDFSRWLNEPVKNLSGGYQRILEVMLILKSQQPFVMLDEPFSGLMPLHIDVLKQSILEEKVNKGIIISDHLYRHILDISSKTYLLLNGKTYLVSNLDELSARGYIINNE